MKKILLYILVINLLILTVNAEEISTDEWYQYNGYSTSHSFSVKFPPTWQAKTMGDDMQGFAPNSVDEDVFFVIQEFEGQTYDQVYAYNENENTSLVEVKDFIFSGTKDLVAKEAIYLNKTVNKSYPITLIKRGGLIIALKGKNLDENADFPTPEDYQETIEAMHDSFSFTDDWHQYIDLEENFTFIFPSNLEMNNLSDGVTITDPNDSNKPIFSIFKYKNISLEDAPEETEGNNEDFIETEEIVFHGIENAISATYRDNEENKKFKKIFIEKDGTVYSLSGENIETNFPRMDYYNEYIAEMLESFEFFDIEGNYQTYKYFPDVADNHQNKKAINYLTEKKIISGYPDGTFKPDGEINRAELTKMIVAVNVTPDASEYKDCFPDVKEEWFAPYICYAKEQGWVQGYEDGTFKPEQKINRAEALKIILEAIFNEIDENETLENNNVTDVDTTEWYGKYFIFADNRDLLDKQHITEQEGKYSYYPSQNITRKEVAETIYRSILIIPLTFL